MTARPEQQLQLAVVGHLDWRASAGTWWCHYPAGGRRNAVEAAIFKSLGVKAGTPDFLLVKRGRLYCLELKSERGRLSRAQVECHEDLRRAGARVATATGIDQALAILGAWGILGNPAAGATSRHSPAKEK
jgi:hypothetical protein